MFLKEEKPVVKITDIKWFREIRCFTITLKFLLNMGHAFLQIIGWKDWQRKKSMVYHMSSLWQKLIQFRCNHYVNVDVGIRSVGGVKQHREVRYMSLAINKLNINCFPTNILFSGSLIFLSLIYSQRCYSCPHSVDISESSASISCKRHTGHFALHKDRLKIISVMIISYLALTDASFWQVRITSVCDAPSFIMLTRLRWMQEGGAFACLQIACQTVLQTSLHQVFG